MKSLTLRETAIAVGSKDIFAGSFCGVYTDSRKPIAGGLFIALEGEKFDGHDFVINAEKDGAAAIIARKKVNCSIPVIYVDDTKKALLALGGYYRSLFDIRLIGLTGSVGKTTTKEMTYEVISQKYNAIKTQGNLNNDIGMPMTLFTIEEDTTAAVIEMGMNHKGEISTLTNVSKPDIAIITNIGVSHIENLGSRENILAAKLEILEGMKKGSSLVVCGDNDLLSTVKSEDYEIVLYGIENENSFVRAVNIEMLPEGTNCDFVVSGKSYRVFVPVSGIHNVYNALAAFTVGIKEGIAPEVAAAAIKNYVPSGMRQRTVKKGDMVFIEDCYNASPDSVKAGINALVGMNGKRSIAVLGDMLELGDYSQSAHTLCGEYAAEKSVDCVFTYGKEAHYIASAAKAHGVLDVFEFDDKKELIDKLLCYIKPCDAILFKASRGMRLEDVIKAVYEKIN